MKKIMMLLIAAVMLFGVTGHAMAAFQEGDLIRVVYSGTGSGTEYATDLGAFSATTPITSNNPLTGTDTFSLSNLGTSATFANTNVAYFIYSSTANAGNGGAWTSGSAASGGYPNIGTFWSNMSGAAGTSLAGWQATAGSANSVAMLQSDPSSYWTNANIGGFGVGTMGGYLSQSTGKTGIEANLAALSTNAYVDQVLYYYGATPDATGARGTSIGVLRTFANGSTELIAPQATPIPAAIYLFGSGLMGLVGLRRKTVA